MPKLTNKAILADQCPKLGFAGEEHASAGTPSGPAPHQHTVQLNLFWLKLFFSRVHEIAGWVSQCRV